MLPYAIIFLVASFLYFKPVDKGFQVGFYVFGLILILFSGFRDMIGGYDVHIYAQVFNSGNKFIMAYKAFEPGFRAYYILLKYLKDATSFMFFTTAAIIMILQFFVIKKHSPIVYFSLFIMFCEFFLMSFVYLRQGIAIGIVWLAIPYILNRSFLKFMMCMLLAFLFHKSSIIFLPMYFIWNIKLTNLSMFIISVLAVIISISPLSTFLLGIVAENLNDSKVDAYVANSGGINFFYFTESAVLIWLILQYRQYFYRSKEGVFMINGLFVYVLINVMSLTNGSFIRFGWYYFIFLVLVLPYIYIFIKDQRAKGLYKLLVFFYFTFVFFRLLIVYDGGDFMPYKSIFQDFNRHGRWEYLDK